MKRTSRARTSLDIVIEDHRPVDLHGGVVINGFADSVPIGTIASSCLISTLELKPVASVESEEFPPIAIIYEGAPHPPGRVYASEQLKLAVFMGEFPPSSLERPLAKAVFEWARRHGCSVIISPLAVSTEEKVPESEGGKVRGVGSTESARQRLSEAGIPPVIFGAAVGVSAVLLNEGRRHNFDVVVLVVKTQKGVADFRAGARVAQAIGSLAPSARCDVQPLLAEAERSEAQLKDIREQAKPLMSPIYT